MFRLFVRLIPLSALFISLLAMTANASQSPLVDTYWKLVSVSGVPAEQGRRDPHLIFSPDGGLTGNTGCNNLGAVYTRDEDRIDFGPILTTRMYCAETAQTERQLLKGLRTVERWTISGDRLELKTAGGVTVAVFEAKDV